jgi:hypothetical protein
VKLIFFLKEITKLKKEISLLTYGNDKEAISQLVQKCLDAKGVNCEAWEKEIDDRIAALYGL